VGLWVEFVQACGGGGGAQGPGVQNLGPFHFLGGGPDRVNRRMLKASGPAGVLAGGGYGFFFRGERGGGQFCGVRLRAASFD
jgi:hypothetical protein